MKNNIMITAGIDIGDRYSKICVVDEDGGEIVVVEETRIRTRQEDVVRYFGSQITTEIPSAAADAIFVAKFGP
jgi:predicted NBD/HSP70 family sugar kinase